MKNQSKSDVEVLSKQDRRRIYALLKSRSIKSFWEVGQILDTLFAKRVPYRAWPKIVDELRAVGDDAPVSQAQLHQCRRLSATWTQIDVKAAMKAGLTWGHAINLVYIWSRGVELNRPDMIEKCKRLIEEYGKSGNGELKPWLAKLKGLQKQAQSGNEFISKFRLLGEKRTAIILKLVAAAEMLGELRGLLPSEAHPECTATNASVYEITKRLERLFKTQ